MIISFLYTASCSQLTPPLHGSCSADPCSGTQGVRLNFACDNGYELRGATDVVCLDTTQWTAASPRCIGKVFSPMLCLPLYVIQNV